MATRQRIGIQDPQSKERGSVTAYIVQAQNHLLQTRWFAFDGRDWYYQPDTRAAFQKVNTMDVPDNAVKIMAAHTGFTDEVLRAQ